MVDKPLVLRKITELEEYLEQIREYSDSHLRPAMSETAGSPDNKTSQSKR